MARCTHQPKDPTKPRINRPLLRQSRKRQAPRYEQHGRGADIDPLFQAAEPVLFDAHCWGNLSVVGCVGRSIEPLSVHVADRINRM